jgi:predicted RNase H-like nuclease
MHFFGIDLAFKGTNPSGLVVLNENGAFRQRAYLCSDADIVNFIAQEADPGGNAIVIDAPLICKNKEGQRPCETEIGKRYGRYGASCHSSNLGNDAGRRGPRLVAALQDRCPASSVRRDARQASSRLWPVIETYPHPGHIEMFGLEHILRYKHKKDRTMEDKKRELIHYMELLRGLSRRVPRLKVDTIRMLAEDLTRLKGQPNYKRQEDLLDALFCAYTALYLWHHRGDPARWRTFPESGDADFITVPCRGSAPLRRGGGRRFPSEPAAARPNRSRSGRTSSSW